jgi:hypothetical protein
MGREEIWPLVGRVDGSTEPQLKATGAAPRKYSSGVLNGNPTFTANFLKKKKNNKSQKKKKSVRIV